MVEVEVPNHIVRRLELAQRRIESDLADIAIRTGNPPRLTHAQSRLLQMIPPQGITATQLSGHARITKQGLGQMVDLLEDRGMVRRRPDPEDRRSRIITRTPAGEEALTAINQMMVELQSHLEKVLGSATYQALSDALYTLGRDELDPYTDPAVVGRGNTAEAPDNT